MSESSSGGPFEPSGTFMYSVGEPAPPIEPTPYTPLTQTGTHITVEPTQLELYKKAYEMACALAEAQRKTIESMERTIRAQANTIRTLRELVDTDELEGEPDVD